MGDVIPIGGIAKLDAPVDKILEDAKGKMKSVILIGWDNDDDMYFGSTSPSGPEVLWLLEQCKLALLDAAVEGDNDID